MSLKEKAESMNSGKGIEFMSNRTKGEMKELLDNVVTIRDYAFINGEDGEYAVFIVDEIKDSFYFGGSVITNNLKELSEEEHQELKAEGLPTLFTERKAKKGNRTYIAVEFYPETSDDLPF